MKDIGTFFDDDGDIIEWLQENGGERKVDYDYLAMLDPETFRIKFKVQIADSELATLFLLRWS